MHEKVRKEAQRRQKEEGKRKEIKHPLAGHIALLIIGEDMLEGSTYV